MRFTVSSSALSSKLNMLVKVIGSKNSLPILDNFLFQVANGELSITASDNDNIIKSNIALTDCEGEGESSSRTSHALSSPQPKMSYAL